MRPPLFCITSEAFVYAKKKIFLMRRKKCEYTKKEINSRCGNEYKPQTDSNNICKELSSKNF